jgi:hypothetical protein
MSQVNSLIPEAKEGGFQSVPSHGLGEISKFTMGEPEHRGVRMIGPREYDAAKDIEERALAVLELHPEILVGIGRQPGLEHLPEADCHARIVPQFMKHCKPCRRVCICGSARYCTPARDARG